jgi:hypothetical protein
MSDNAKQDSHYSTDNEKPQQDLRDFRIHLTKYKQKPHTFICPVCSGKLSISDTTGAYTCFDNGCKREEIIAAIGLPEEEKDQKYKDAANRRNQERQEAERTRRQRLRTESERDIQWQQIISSTFLSDRHRAEMESRGYTNEQIVRSQARSLSKGRVIPITSATGKFVGSQIIKDAENEDKAWYGIPGTHKLKETNELPLAVVYPDDPIQEIVAICESVCDKPHRASAILNMVTIGSTRLGTQPVDLVRSIATIKDRLGWDKIEYRLLPDGGAVINHHVMSSYRTLERQIKKLGGELKVGWWNQINKSDGDIDEIDPVVVESIHWINFSEFEAISAKQNWWMNSFFAAFRPKRERSEGFKPKPRTLTKVEYKNTDELLAVISDAIAKGYRGILDTTHAGGQKSTTSAQIDGIDGIDNYFYVVTNHRNPSTPEVESNFADLPSRNERLYINPDQTTPNGNPWLQTTQPKGVDWEMLVGNCHQAGLHHTLTQKGHDLSGDSNPICKVCPQLNACNHAVGKGYGYLHLKRKAFQEPRLRAHPQSLPHPGAYEYEKAMLIFDDTKIQIQKQVKATAEDFRQTLADLAINDPDLLLKLAPLITKLNNLFGKTEHAYHGFGHREILDNIQIENLSDVYRQAVQATTPNFQELIAECDGVNTQNMSKDDKRAVKAADRLMAQNSKLENRERLRKLPTNWLVKILEVMSIGEGYVRFDNEILIVTQPDQYFRNVLNTCKISLHLDATGDPDELARMMGCSIEQILVISKPQPTYPNLKVIQILEMGTPGKDLSISMQSRLDAMIGALTQKHQKLGVIRKERIDGAGLWFADSRGSNAYKDADALVLIGSPCPNLGAMAAEFSVLYGRQVAASSEDQEYRSFISTRVEAEIVQGLARLRAHLSPETEKTVYLIAERTDLPLERVMGYYPGAKFDQLQAIDVTVEAGSLKQQLRHKIVSFLKEHGEAVTQEQIAKGLKMTQGAISKAFKALGGFKKIFHTLCSSLYTIWNKSRTTDSELVDWEKILDPAAIDYLKTGIIDNEGLSLVEKMAEVAQVARLLTTQQIGILLRKVGKIHATKFLDLLYVGTIKSPITSEHTILLSEHYL